MHCTPTSKSLLECSSDRNTIIGNESSWQMGVAMMQNRSQKHTYTYIITIYIIITSYIIIYINKIAIYKYLYNYIYTTYMYPWTMEHCTTAGVVVQTMKSIWHANCASAHLGTVVVASRQSICEIINSWTLLLATTSPKTSMTKEHPPSGDVFPIEHGDFPMSC